MMYLLRHAEAEFKPLPDHPGQAADAPLTERGSRQANALVSPLSKLGITHIHTSPFLRAKASVMPFASAAKLVMTEDARLQERRRGLGPDATYLDEVRLLTTHPEASPHGSESGRDVLSRGMPGIDAARAAGQVPLVATHGQFLSVILSALGETCGFDMWRAMPNPALFEVTETGWRMIPLELDA